jgi:hypothetical protein
MTQLVNLSKIRDIPTTTDVPDPEPHTWQPANLIQLAANPPEPPTIGGLLYPGKRTVLSGETESMKTWLALILCKAELDIGLPVCWVDLDAMGPGAMLERLQLLGVTDEQIGDFLYYEPSGQLTATPKTDLTATIAARGIRLCVIDAFNPILSMHALDPNSVTDVERSGRTSPTRSAAPAQHPSSSTTSSRTPKRAANTARARSGRRPARSSTSASSCSRP